MADTVRDQAPPATDGNYWMRKDAPGGADPDSHRQSKVPTNRVSACPGNQQSPARNAQPPLGRGERSTTGPF